MIRATERGLVQVEPARPAFHVQPVLVPVKLFAADEVVQHLVPLIGKRIQACAHNIIGSDAGDPFHCVVPHQYFAIVADGAGCDRQVLQGLTIMPAQIIQLTGKTCQLALVISQRLFDVMDILARASSGLGFESQMMFDDVLGYRRPHQA